MATVVTSQSALNVGTLTRSFATVKSRAVTGRLMMNSCVFLAFSNTFV